jgi:hypothetical protein
VGGGGGWLLPVAVDLGFWTDLFILSNRTNPIDLACVDTGTYLSLLLGEGEREWMIGEKKDKGGRWHMVQYRPVSVRWEVAVKAAQARLALPPPRLPGSMPALHSIRCDAASF